ncbi:helix-turn-helix transcriptional regulator [Hymenobacter crusticola]|uniref:HTH araC/xylS-type domain-containing protein n=1 Tax=Hymenobacter crusticola TaxID=1770526 RepID=A0A243W5T9_9BACT|nr:helix-turn-helix transcriptional regulator [Hymenobacter crusticola]OUJ68625.1 hypothetical protein BXP70_27735 [Hymenobacter crusticola]
MNARIAAALRLLDPPAPVYPSVAQMAQAACLSLFHFHRLFKQQTGYSPHQYVAYHRLQRAYQMLLQEDQAILELALTLGYVNCETFSRAFKKRFKIAPHDLRAVINRAVAALRANGEEPPGSLRVLLYPNDNEDELMEAVAHQFAGATRHPDIVFLVLPSSRHPTLPVGATRIHNKFDLQQSCCLCQGIRQRLALAGSC